MSTKYTGGFITKSPVAPTTSAASGIWTLDQQQQAQKAGTWPSPPLFIEDLFSTYLYTGTGAALTITNGIDLSTNGGLVWQKSRSAAGQNFIFDTARGALQYLSSNSTDASANYGQSLTAFNTNGFNLGFNLSNSGETDVTWTFREQPKFFDIVTWTGDSTAGKTIAHNLGSTPGCIMVKCTSSVLNWAVFHTSLGNTGGLILNLTNANMGPVTWWNSTSPTSTNFTLGSSSAVNLSGETYVAYLFAHDAGGFPVSGGGSTNGITCGSFTTDGSGLFSVTLGYEPQWVMVKRSSGVGDWIMFDTMRGMPTAAASGVFSATLLANTTAAEDAAGGTVGVNATGFNSLNGYLASSSTFIYIAIRRGPMKPPTVGTSVFSPIAYTGNSTTNTTVQNLTTSFSGDTAIIQQRTSGNNPLVFDKLRGSTQGLYTSLTLAEENISTARPGQSVGFNNTQTVLTGQFTTQGNYNYSGDTFVGWNFRRAPGFFDEVCYTGTGISGQAFTHNLGVAPELMLVKVRGNGYAWYVYDKINGSGGYFVLNTTALWQANTTVWGSANPTASVFTVGSQSQVNENTTTFVAYLFATLAGVSKVGGYTGNGSSQTIACGFTGGSRFVLIKRSDSTGDWYVWDSARGIVAGNDPHLSLNTTAAEVTTDDSVDTDNTGFIVNQNAATDINVTSATYIFLAIA